MGNYIVNNNNDTIWKCSNDMLEFTYQMLKELCERDKIDNKKILNLIDDLDQDTYGRGCICTNIDNFLKTKKDFLVFANLVKQAIELCQQRYKWFDELAVKKANELYENIIKESQTKSDDVERIDEGLSEAPKSIVDKLLHLRLLMTDPDDKIGVTEKGVIESLAGIALEEHNKLAGLLKRETTGTGEYVDALGTVWDVYTPLSLDINRNRVFNVKQVAGKIKGDLQHQATHIILSLIRMDKSDIINLTAELSAVLNQDEIKRVMTVIRNQFFMELMDEKLWQMLF